MTSSLIKKKPFKRTKEGGVEEQYIDLGEATFEDEPGAAEGSARVRVAEIFRYEDINDLTQNLYAGNVLVIDYTSIANDELAMKRLVNELKAVARDTGGDVAGIAKNLLIATPSGMKVDRSKIRGSF
ncbi:MAG: cell division protein SepF [Candidatus Thermoplasmatota archaeon]